MSPLLPGANQGICHHLGTVCNYTYKTNSHYKELQYTKLLLLTPCEVDQVENRERNHELFSFRMSNL